MTQFIFPKQYKIVLIALLFVCTTLLLTACPVACCGQSPTATLCRQLGGQYEQSEASSGIIAGLDSQEYCVLANDDFCRLAYNDSGAAACTPVSVGWRPMALDTENAVVAALTTSFTQTVPSFVTIIEAADQVGKGSELWFVSPPMPGTRVEAIAATITETLAQLGWQENTASVKTDWSDYLERTTSYYSQFTMSANLCKSIIGWSPSTEFLHCSENVSGRDCILNSPESYVFTVALTCAEAVNTPTAGHTK